MLCFRNEVETGSKPGGKGQRTGFILTVSKHSILPRLEVFRVDVRIRAGAKHALYIGRKEMYVTSYRI